MAPKNGKKQRQITFSWVYTIVLTNRCAWHCGYCPYPTTAGLPLPSDSKVLEAIHYADALGLRQIKLTSGESIENHPEITSAYRYYGFSSFTEYLRGILDRITQNTVAPALFPELDLGAQSFVQLHQLRSHIFTLRLFLDSLDPRLKHGVAHSESRGKWPDQRLSALLTAGRLGIPVNSGMMIGIGERPKWRTETLKTLAEVSRRYGHIQSVTIRPFKPEPRTAMQSYPAPPIDLILETVAEARRILPDSVAIQSPSARFPERALDFVEAGADDLGEFELTDDAKLNAQSVNAFQVVKARLDDAGIRLADRLSLFPRFSTTKWVTPRYRKLLEKASTETRPISLQRELAGSA